LNKIRIMIIDEQPYYRNGIRSHLETQPDLEVVDYDPTEEGIASIDNWSPDVVLLGSDLASYNGMELGARIARRYPNTKVIMLSPNPSDQDLFEVIRSSAVACLDKKVGPNDLISNIRRAARGEYPINDNVMNRPSVAKKVLKTFQEMEIFGNNIEAVVAPLTNRERQILSYIAEGNSNKQIARILSISEQTIKNHVSAIMRKLNANDRAHAVVLAIRRGLINVEESPL